MQSDHVSVTYQQPGPFTPQRIPIRGCTTLVLPTGVTSVYWWEGKVEESLEQLLIIKTQTSLVGKLTKHVQAKHPYDECEVISTPVNGGSASYLSWVCQSTQEGCN